MIHPSLLREIESTKIPVNINGVGGLQRGPFFFRVYINEDMHTNVLSFSEVEDKYHITYIPQEALLYIYLTMTSVEHRGMMFIADWSKSMSVYITTGVFTKAEELHAKRAF